MSDVFGRLRYVTPGVGSYISYVDMALWFLYARVVGERPVLATSLMALCLLAWTPLVNGFFALFSTNGGYVDKASAFPGHLLLESNWRVIRDEALGVIDESSCFGNAIANIRPLEHQGQVCWKWFPIHSYKGFTEAALAKMPRTVALLRDIPDAVTSFLSILEGGSGLKPHIGYYKGILRYHLGLVIPRDGDAVLTVDGIDYRWKEGEGVMFDDMYVHSVRNDSSSVRVVLFVDVMRRDLPQWLDAINRAILRTLSGFFSQTDRDHHKNMRTMG